MTYSSRTQLAFSTIRDSRECHCSNQITFGSYSLYKETHCLLILCDKKNAMSSQHIPYTQESPSENECWRHCSLNFPGVGFEPSSLKSNFVWYTNHSTVSWESSRGSTSDDVNFLGLSIFSQNYGLYTKQKLLFMMMVDISRFKEYFHPIF